MGNVIVGNPVTKVIGALKKREGYSGKVDVYLYPGVYEEFLWFFRRDVVVKHTGLTSVVAADKIRDFFNSPLPFSEDEPVVGPREFRGAIGQYVVGEESEIGLTRFLGIRYDLKAGDWLNWAPGQVCKGDVRKKARVDLYFR